MKHKVGDKVWFVPGDRKTDLIAIQVTILSVDKEDKYYVVDEAFYRPITDDDLFETRETAEDELVGRYYQHEENDHQSPSLAEYRKSVVKWLKKLGATQLVWPEKSRKDWFNFDTSNEKGG